MNKTPTVTVATCAYNEENNIANYLKSVIAQQQVNYHLEQILIVSDGSTDGTLRKIRAQKASKIRIWDFKKREGKSKRLNQIFKSLDSDILVLFDSDTELADPQTIVRLIGPLSDKKVGLVSGSSHPIIGKTLIERGVNSSFRVYSKLKDSGNGAYSCDGRVLALSKKFASSTYIPPKMIGIDAYLYFAATTKGFKFKHVKDAIVNYRSPATVSDQIKQNTRFIAAHQKTGKNFRS